MKQLICRLCLTDSSKDTMHLLTVGCEIINKLSFCLSHHIDITPDLPSVICDICFKTVEEIFIFREKIIKNESFLQNKLNDPISEIKCESIVKFDTKTVSNEQIEIYTCDEENIEHRDFVLDVETKAELQETKCNIKDEDNVSDDNLNTEEISSEETQVLHQSNLNLLENNMCLTCFKKFPSRLDLLDHYQNEERLKHSTNDTENIEQLKYKILNVNGSIVYKCEQCSKEYRSEKFIKRHFATHKDRPFLCKFCGRTYRTAIEFVNHAKVHGGETFVCSFKCGYSSVHKHVVKDHERRHRKEFKYTCETCGKQFQVKTWYLQHQNIHTGAKPYVCNFCGMAFPLDRYLTQHRNTVHPKEVTQKRYLCIHCSIPCSSKHGLALHLKEHDSSTLESLCDECGKVLKNARQLKCHKRIHMNPKPYVCGTCDKTFTKKCYLVVHELSHTDTRYPCDGCTKRFTQRSSLNRHLLRCRQLTKKCGKCSKTFYNKTDFMKHNKTCN
ncbi:zinc finger protein OZF-like [Aricia agestis]|uniref:zinc finger protein OZF-like n=1 Tax=Aricia agestis TaxID=91739 RepID=UPI001C2046BE|nr:zinc finger protein OZF-like [Aricia agestis]